MEQEKLAVRAVGVEEFRRIASLGRNTAYGLLNTPGGVRALRVGKKWVIPMVEVDRWLSSAGQ
jgi:hypothetical protein